MNAGNMTYTDKFMMVDSSFNPGETSRVEMKDVSYEFLPGIQSNELLNFMLGNSCSNPCGDPENEGFSKYDFESHCMVFRIIAKRVGRRYLPGGEEKPIYEIKAVYITSI